MTHNHVLYIWRFRRGSVIHRWAAPLLASVFAAGLLVQDARSDDAGFLSTDESATTACTVTAKAARRACFNEAKDDYWIGFGNCVNLADPLARADCQDEVKLEHREAKTLCAEQYDARLDLCDVVGEAPYDPVLDPADFLTADELLAAASPNPYLPLVPGTTRRYAGGDETIEVTITDEVKLIFGIPALVVHDVASESGEVIEDTFDWFAQDIHGNVWYLGEISRDFEDGELVSIEGSWKAYRDFARPGIVMPAAARIGDVYRQEFALGDAEDAAAVLDLAGTASVPAASCAGDCLITKDFTPISPDAIEHKYYAPGIGLILEVDVETGERVELVEITP